MFNTGMSMQTWAGQDFTGRVRDQQSGKSEVRLTGVTSQAASARSRPSHGARPSGSVIECSTVSRQGSKVFALPDSRRETAGLIESQ